MDSKGSVWLLELGIWTPTLWRGPSSWGYGLAIGRIGLGTASVSEAWKKGCVCFAVFNCTTKGGEKRYLYRGCIVDVSWDADSKVKTHCCGDVHASELVAWATPPRYYDGARSLARMHPNPPVLGRFLLTRMRMRPPPLHLSKPRRSGFRFLLDGRRCMHIGGSLVFFLQALNAPLLTWRHQNNMLYFDRGTVPKAGKKK